MLHTLVIHLLSIIHDHGSTDNREKRIYTFLQFKLVLMIIPALMNMIIKVNACIKTSAQSFAVIFVCWLVNFFVQRHWQYLKRATVGRWQISGSWV